jgi:hypothetical protein
MVPFANSLGVYWEARRKPPTRLLGVLVLSNRYLQDRCCTPGQYFYSSLEASRELGLKSDVVGKRLRKNRGTPDEGTACALGITFITAKEAYKRGVLPVQLSSKFPWLEERHAPMSDGPDYVPADLLDFNEEELWERGGPWQSMPPDPNLPPHLRPPLPS